MAVKSTLRPITDARIAVIPRDGRGDALAAMARAAGRPHLRPVPSRAKMLTGDPDNDDVMIGMYARPGCLDRHKLVGVVRIRERYAPRITAIEHPQPRERAFLIDALTTSEHMDMWNPPVRTLLAATAATLVATISHDPSFMTYVACRLPDGQASHALAALGGRPLEVPPEVDGSRLCFGDVPSRELQFLDNDAAATAASIVLGHMTGGIVPSNVFDLPGKGKTCEALLKIAFPRALDAIRPEIDLLARSEIDLEWRAPRVVSNDVTFPMRAAHGI